MHGEKHTPSSSNIQPAKATKSPGEAKGKDQQPGLTTLQANMKKSLDGARFRCVWINEVLYKSDSVEAHKLMSEDPAVFADYHTGFRHQVESWPTNPVSYYISSLSSYPPKTVIADLGCGDAALARALLPKGITILSFDLVSDNTYVVEADTCARVPLPGSEPSPDSGSSEGEGQVVDVVVCALSLMGTNWPGCIREAWRILRSGGELRIAEVTSRFTSVDEFVSFVSSFGFKVKAKDERNTHFTLFEFKKIPRKPKSEKDWEKLSSRGSILKPCEYKRR
ncbi:methyltransferase-domain-containing protein [Daedaleopsis nitida]|nr:methyltransferase-domain-containing protein [Daedaleopsis nitida]